MIQIIACVCTKNKLVQSGVVFFTDNNFFPEIERVFVVIYQTRQFFVDTFNENCLSSISCKCLEMDKGRCNACKTICFNLNFIAQKIKMSILNVPDSIQRKPIEVYLKKGIKKMLFFTFVNLF